jgi:tRNA1(Val) A37 N6-methylase TrmN6
MIRAADNIEQSLTKHFYDRFKVEHAAFFKSIIGVTDEATRQWYASVMLNRLMFIYFLQWNGFLNEDKNYLRSKLKQSKGRGRDRFYSELLCQLFFQGLAKKQDERAAVTNSLLGDVAYLNGGLFLSHEIETKSVGQLQIPDTAFERVLDFFDQYKWHLDESPLHDDRTINPGVLGYIFEQYINQKQMGAYYTKGDITEYISKNTIIPFLLDAARQECRDEFEGEQSVWLLLRADPDRYIYPAVKKGVESSLLSEDAEDLTHNSKCDEWKNRLPESYSLPTETCREMIARRRRCREVRAKLANGEISDVNDLITYNLNICRFAQDVIENCNNPAFLYRFWRALKRLTVLDPTCGSGAFLLAALDILEPLYETCLERMQVLLRRFEQTGEKQNSDDIRSISEVLAAIDIKEKQFNRRYFILSSIIVNNLFGVDIMDEAVEVCKLRLFLKLVAQIRPGDQIEPLPDIDFNVRAGNTLVGYATCADMERAITGKLDFGNAVEQIERQAQDIGRMFKGFRKQQAETGGEVVRQDKERLCRQLTILEDDLNHHLAGDYGIGPDQKTVYKKWLTAHKPFHWFVEFYEIINDGGFDVIIGNPPYVNAIKIRQQYKIRNYETAACPDLYAWVLERATCLLKTGGRSGMIVPLSLGFSNDLDSCRKLLFREYGENWFASFARIPSALFNFDVRVRNTIHIGYKSKRSAVPHTTRLHRWFEAARPHLFALLEYAPFVPELWRNKLPKLNTLDLSTAFEQLIAGTQSTAGISLFPKKTPYALHFKKTAYNWLNFCHELPPCYDGDGKSIPHTKFGDLYFIDSHTRDLAFLFLNGKIMFAFWCIIGDDFDVSRWMFADFPINLNSIPPETSARLLQLTKDLKDRMVENVSFKLNAGKKVGNYNLAKCREVTDKSDVIFAEYLGLREVWPDIELLYDQIVKTDFDNDAEAEAAACAS